MATHPDTVRQSVSDHVVDKLDEGNINPNAQLVLQTAADAEVSTHEMSLPAFGNASSTGVATAAAIADDTNATGGIATKMELKNRNLNAVILGTVGTSGSGAEMILSDNNIPPGATVQIISLTYTAMP